MKWREKKWSLQIDEKSKYLTKLCKSLLNCQIKRSSTFSKMSNLAIYCCLFWEMDFTREAKRKKKLDYALYNSYYYLDVGKCRFSSWKRYRRLNFSRTLFDRTFCPTYNNNSYNVICCYWFFLYVYW